MNNYGIIDVDRYVQLLYSDQRQQVQDWFRENSNLTMCYEMRALNQQLTVWEAHFYTVDSNGRAQYNHTTDVFVTHTEIVETTPAAPHWPVQPHNNERTDHNG